MQIRKCKRCGRGRQHWAKGLCRSCYNTVARQRRRALELAELERLRAAVAKQ